MEFKKHLRNILNKKQLGQENKQTEEEYRNGVHKLSERFKRREWKKMQCPILRLGPYHK